LCLFFSLHGFGIGGALSDAAAEWNVRAVAATYAPPKWSKYTFGTYRCSSDFRTTYCYGRHE
jgi:hypothetical protein